MKRASGDSTKETARLRLLWRSESRERLARNLTLLSSCCQSCVIPQENGEMHAIVGSKELGYWPSAELLWWIERDVFFLYFLERRKPIWPIWQAFEHVDWRMKKLELESRVTALLDRA